MAKESNVKYVDTKFICACGNEFVSKSVKPEVKVEVCSACHPFYTGKHNQTTRKGKIEQFNSKYGYKVEE